MASPWTSSRRLQGFGAVWVAIDLAVVLTGCGDDASTSADDEVADQGWIGHVDGSVYPVVVYRTTPPDRPSPIPPGVPVPYPNTVSVG